MKRYLLLLVSLSISLFTFATESLSIPDFTINPGGDAYFYVDMQSETYYSGYSMDIYIPEELEVCLYDGANDVYFADDSSIYPNSRNQYYHSIEASVNVENDKKFIRILCVDATKNNVFNSTSGRLFYVHVKASSYMKPGNYSIEIKNPALVKKDATKYVPNDVVKTFELGTTGSATLKVSASAHWSTCVLPFSVTDIPSAVKVYSCSDKDEESIHLTRVSIMDAYTPYILYSEDGYNGSVEGTVYASAYPQTGYVNDGYLYGAIVPQSITGANCFVLQNLNGVVQFYNASNGTYTIPAGKCWLQFSEGSSNERINGFSFVVDDVTGIDDITMDHASNAYGIDGRKVNKMESQQLYIQDGRKLYKK